MRSEIINWYLEKIEDQINDESELLEKKSFIEKILDRLVYNVRHINQFTYTNFIVNTRVVL